MIRCAVEDVMLGVLIGPVSLVEILFLIVFKVRVVSHIRGAGEIVLNGLECDGDE